MKQLTVGIEQHAAQDISPPEKGSVEWSKRQGEETEEQNKIEETNRKEYQHDSLKSQNAHKYTNRKQAKHSRQKGEIDKLNKKDFTTVYKNKLKKQRYRQVAREKK